MQGYKVCPQCSQQNTLEAAQCTQCRFDFPATVVHNVNINLPFGNSQSFNDYLKAYRWLLIAIIIGGLLWGIYAGIMFSESMSMQQEVMHRLYRY